MDNRINVKFSWPTSSANHEEINSITILMDRVPRIGELLYIDVKVDDEEFINKTLRVKDVWWKIRNDSYSVIIICS